MLIYVEWKIDLNKDNKVNILRILLDKDPNIKYDISTKKLLLGSLKVGIDEEFDSSKIYFTRVKIGSANKIVNGITNEIQMCVLEKHTQIEKSIDVYLSGTKRALTSNLKELYYLNNFGIDNQLFENKLSKLNIYGTTNFTNLTGDQYIISVGSEQLN